MSCHRTSCPFRFASLARTLLLTVGVAFGAATVATAQTALPGIVVEGGTIAAPPVRRPPRPAGDADTEAKSPKAAKKAAAADDDGGSGGGTQAAADGQAAGGASAAGGGTGAGGIPADQSGTSVSVVTAEDLRRLEIRNAAEALRGLPGVAVSHGGGFTGMSQLRIRGAEGNHTMVLIDGIEVNVPSSCEFDFSNLLSDDIAQIEVLRGPMSGLYGSGAVGGVVNIITRSGQGPATARARVETGAFNTTDMSASLSGGSEALHGLVSVQRRSTSGFNVSPLGSENDPATLTNLMLKAGALVMPGLAVDFTVRNMHKTGGRDGDGGVPGQLATQVDTLSTFASNVFLAGVNARLETLGGLLTHRLYANRVETQLEDTDVSAFGSLFSRNDNVAIRAGYAATLRFETPLFIAARHAVTALIEQEQQSFNPVTADGIERARGRLATALEYRLELAGRLFLSAALRHDDNDTFDDFTTWRGAASFKLGSLAGIALRPHASVGTGVKLPTMFEQLGVIPNLFTPNPNLKPETSRGWDAGLELGILEGRAILDLTYFRQTLEDEIETVFAPVWTAINRQGTSHREGVEVAGRWRPFDAFTLGISYTYLDAREPDGSREVRRPPHSGRIDLATKFGNGKGTLNLAAVYNGRTDDTAFRLPFFTAERVTLGEYWLVTAAAAWQLAPGFEVYGRVENLLNERYQEIYGFNTPGIAAYVGLRITAEEVASVLDRPRR